MATRSMPGRHPGRLLRSMTRGRSPRCSAWRHAALVLPPVQGRRVQANRPCWDRAGRRALCTTRMVERRRVVVTGMGMVSPLGLDLQSVWRHLMDGHCGVVALEDEAFDAFPCRVAAPVPEFEPEAWVAKEQWQSTKSARFIQFALAASAMALDDAGWRPGSDSEKCRTGVALGSGIGGVTEIARTAQALATRGYRRVSPFFVPSILANLPAGQVCIAHDLRGPNHTASTACATGAHAIGDAARLVAMGSADVMLAGATDACIAPIGLAGFCRMNALSTQFNDQPERASRPFDADRDGFVMGEGAGVLVLEALDHALERGARVYAEVSGYGLSSDAYHITQPSPDSRGAKASMRAALLDAGVSPEHVDYVNAHATSTPIGDELEINAIGAIMKDGGGATQPWVSSTKGATGHLLGAAGAVESIVSVLSIHHQQVPPTVNLSTPVAHASMRHVPCVGHDAQVGVAMNNSFGFGGTNATLVFKRMQ